MHASSLIHNEFPHLVTDEWCVVTSPSSKHLLPVPCLHQDSSSACGGLGCILGSFAVPDGATALVLVRS